MTLPSTLQSWRLQRKKWRHLYILASKHHDVQQWSLRILLQSHFTDSYAYTVIWSIKYYWILLVGWMEMQTRPPRTLQIQASPVFFGGWRQEPPARGVQHLAPSSPAMSERWARGCMNGLARLAQFKQVKHLWFRHSTLYNCTAFWPTYTNRFPSKFPALFCGWRQDIAWQAEPGSSCMRILLVCTVREGRQVWGCDNAATGNFEDLTGGTRNGQGLESCCLKASEQEQWFSAGRNQPICWLST